MLLILPLLLSLSLHPGKELVSLHDSLSSQEGETQPPATVRKARGRKRKVPEEQQEQEASLPPAKEAREDIVISMSTHGDRQWSEAMLSNLLYCQGRVESGTPLGPPWS